MKSSIIVDLKNKLTGKISEKDIRIVTLELTRLVDHYRIDEQKNTGMSENNKLLDSFLSSKRLEGCSEKTIAYYQTTINMFLCKINSPISSINTEDIRIYLAEYQSERHSSKVTIDNIRRIFSSFFSWLEDEEYILKSPVRRIHKVKLVRRNLHFL